ncbi:MAG TPA: FAD-dependent thymidylate synthase [Candidatus Cloacimonadota bacterium]|nr:FAD-dependent thymidylate synthase [Candidatus Cloacimonadota bacterium]
MKVNVAGYNIDKSLIDRLESKLATPEVISAAYARISRSSKSVSELRKEALLEIDKARKSNQNIIFEMGHSSIAEHAVFNLDIIDVSRLLTDSIESIRLASFTEKSQRYVTLSNDYVLPTELQNSPLAEPYRNLVQELFEEYRLCFEALKAHYSKNLPQLSKRDLEGKAKEDARYILPLATKTQMGLTINARSLENLLRRLDSSPLAEAKELHTELCSKLSSISPSLLRYTSSESFSCQPLDSSILTQNLEENIKELSLLEHSPDPDDRILAAMLYPQTPLPFEACLKRVKALPQNEKERLWQQVWCGMKAWNKVSRAFEQADLSFECSMSESCWAQFKRHRLSSMIKSINCSSVPLIIPPAILELGRAEIWHELWLKCRKLSAELDSLKPGLGSYLRLNLDRVKVLTRMNFRELYHFVRLRSDEHAQWEIQQLSRRLASQTKPIAPLALQELCGKSEFVQKH